MFRILLPNPGLGNELTYLVPDLVRFNGAIVRTFFISFAADANAASRAISLLSRDKEGNIIARYPHPTLITATQSRSISWAAGDNSEVSTFVLVDIGGSGVIIEGGDTLEIDVENIQVGDVISTAYLQIETISLDDEGASIE